MHIQIDTHVHTIASGHAYSTLKEYLEEAKKKDLKLICITDHAPKMPGAPNKMYFSNLKVIPRFIDEIEILTGVELNILDKDGTVDLGSKLLNRMDIVIASLHVPCCPPNTKENNTLAIVNTMKNPFVNIIGHLGDPRYEFDIDKVIYTAKETHTIIELNNSSMNPDNARSGGEKIIRQLLNECNKHNVYVTLGSDAHIYSDIGNFSSALNLLKDVDIKEELILNTPEKLKTAINKKKEL